MAKMYYAADCDIKKLDGKVVSIIGYGSQGHAHAKNLKDSGVNVVVGLRQGGKSWEVAKADGFEVLSVAEATKKGDIVMILIPDELQAAVYEKEIASNLKKDAALAFAHGFNIRYGYIKPPAGVDVFLAAPKGPGHTVRSQFLDGFGVPSLIAVEVDATSNAKEVALAYLAGIGGARAGILETTFKEETETDLFGEQTVLCGGVVDLMRAGFEVLTEAGYSKEAAYFECVHELKLIIDLVNKFGISGMDFSISDTAEYGQYVSGPRIVPADETKEKMRAVLKDIQDGTFAKNWMDEHQAGRPLFTSQRQKMQEHPMEITGKELREKMVWGKNDIDLV